MGQNDIRIAIGSSNQKIKDARITVKIMKEIYYN
jgi:hypothetical protein